jgi:lactoylglutathione lyase
MSMLNLLVLKSENPESLARFYSAFGLSFVREKHGNGPVHHSSNAGGSVFEIYPCANANEKTTGTRIGFKVKSIDQTIAACPSNVRVLSAPKQTPWGRRAVILDPEGHKVELMEG